ncbi:MAG: hypothetical protein Q8Q35_00735 [Nanoarchaeota archaeon]|nr:hypothetical protein [Nanoarchaeota archaeon]
MKRGQFTLFIIIGIVVLLLVGVGIYYRGSILDAVGISQTVSYPSEVQEVVAHVEECFATASVNSVKAIALGGGYLNLPRDVFTSNDISIPYFLYDDQDLTISQELMETELGEYTEILMTKCLNIESFTEFDITEGDREYDITVNADSIDFEMTYPMSVGIDETTIYNLPNTYDETVEARLGHALETAATIVAFDLGSDSIDYDFLLGLDMDNIELLPFNNDTIVYALEDTSAFEDGTSLTFMFAELFPIIVEEEVE